ncbi:MAG: type effector [Pseudomonas orientalis]|nr:type effector [Pseudomonas orientalis]
MLPIAVCQLINTWLEDCYRGQAPSHICFAALLSSCKSPGLALLAFGEHYCSVVATPEGSDHGNIRALIAHGLAGVKFTSEPLTRKS